MYILNNNTEPLVFSEKLLSELIDGGLSKNAFLTRNYFSNDYTHPIAKTWIDCGYRCSEVDRYNKTITLIKINSFTKRLTSSNIIIHYYHSKSKPDFRPMISPFTFIETLRSQAIDQQLLFNYLISIDAIFVDFKCSEISFDNYYQLINKSVFDESRKLSHMMSHTYDCFVKYVLATCFANVTDDTNSVFDSVYYEKLPIQYFANQLIRTSIIKSFKIVNDGVNPKKTYEERIKEIANLDIKTMCRFMAEAEPLELLFYDYAVDNFVTTLKEKSIFEIDPKLVEEMLNVCLINIRKDAVYVTDNRIAQDIVISSLRNRILSFYNK